MITAAGPQTEPLATLRVGLPSFVDDVAAVVGLRLTSAVLPAQYAQCVTSLAHCIGLPWAEEMQPMGAHKPETAETAETAPTDNVVILLVYQLDPVLPGIKNAQRARRIALESVYAGIGLFFAGMIAAAFGVILTAQGVVLQEVFGVAVILNALRVVRDTPSTTCLQSKHRHTCSICKLVSHDEE